MRVGLGFGAFPDSTEFTMHSVSLFWVYGSEGAQLGFCTAFRDLQNKAEVQGGVWGPLASWSFWVVSVLSSDERHTEY